MRKEVSPQSNCVQTAASVCRVSQVTMKLNEPQTQPSKIVLAFGHSLLPVERAERIQFTMFVCRGIPIFRYLVEREPQQGTRYTVRNDISLFLYSMHHRIRLLDPDIIQ